MIAKVALATVAAVGLYIPTMGLPLSHSCLHTVGVAGAAPAPSPSCSGDLRECLRKWADIRQTTFGGRYVTAEDVSLCMETFNACIHGAAGRGGNPSPPASTAGRGENNNSGVIPQRFGVKVAGYIQDCRRSGNSVTCSLNLETLPPGVDSFTAKVTGTLSGSTLTGTWTAKQSGRSLADSACSTADSGSAPVTYQFEPDGTVTMRLGSYEWQSTVSGNCSGSDSVTVPAAEATGTWSGNG